VRTGGGSPAGGEGRKASQNSPSSPRGNRSGRRGSEEPGQCINQKIVQKQENITSRAVDPDSLHPDTDPDPAFKVNPDPDPIRIQGCYDQKLKKKIQQKICFIFF
jgi:hypothetical protein